MSTKEYRYNEVTCDTCGNHETDPKNWYLLKFRLVPQRSVQPGIINEELSSMYDFCTETCARKKRDELIFIQRSMG